MDKLSKTQKKQEALTLQDFGEKLLELSEDEIKTIGLPENILNAVMQAKSITKRGARKRQLQYIGVLMRKIDSAPVRQAIKDREEGYRRQAALHRQLEKWRDDLIAGNEQLIEELIVTLPGAEREHLISLVQKAREETVKKEPSPAPSRALFRYLHKAAS